MIGPELFLNDFLQFPQPLVKWRTERAHMNVVVVEEMWVFLVVSYSVRDHLLEFLLECRAGKPSKFQPPFERSRAGLEDEVLFDLICVACAGALPRSLRYIRSVYT